VTRPERPIAELIDAAVALVPGVVAVYASAPDGMPVRIARAGTPLASVTDAGIVVSVGVADAVPAGETAALVAARVRELAPDARVHVRVSRVHREGPGETP
jgi:hypothetical protein